MLTQTDLTRAVFGAGMKPKTLLFADEFYAAPAKSWVLGDFAQSLRHWVQTLGLSYRQQGFDCDDYARLAATLANVLHNKTGHNPEEHTLSFGELWYLRDGVFDGHCLNIIVLEPDKLFLFEPQTGREAGPLDRVQLAMIELVRF